MHRLVIFYLFFHNLMIHFLGFRECIILFILASVIRIIFMLGKFPGIESFRNEVASLFSTC